MKQYLIVDAYNVINAWDSFEEFRGISLEMARDKLVEVLQEYASFHGQELIIVFDAHHVKGKERHFDQVGDVQIIYTKEGETADSVIERLSHELVEAGQVVFVATSDWTEQKVIFGKGAFRKSARELWEEWDSANKEITRRFRENKGDYTRPTLGHRIGEEVRQRLEKLRYEKE